MALTYQPKIEAVKAGLCGQTVRLLAGPGEIVDKTKRLKHAGDEVLLHTWAGKPYYSKWDWRSRYVLSEVRVLYYGDFWRWSPLDPGTDRYSELNPVSDSFLRDIARQDHIDPPTVEEWEAVLLRLNNLKTLEDTDWEVIRWPCVPDPAYRAPAPARTLDSWEEPAPWAPTIEEVLGR